MTPVTPRNRLPLTRESTTHHAEVRAKEGTVDLYITCSTFSDGRLGEVFIKASLAGSRLHGFMDNLGITISIALQHGAPLTTIVQKYKHTKFEPAGKVWNVPPDMLKNGRPYFPCTSVLDYLAHYLEFRFLGNGHG